MFEKEDTLKVKGVAISLLLFHHLFSSMKMMEQNNIELHFMSGELVSKLASGARICVWIFAFLSAYGLSKGYENQKESGTKRTTSFLVRRWWSLMKSYWFVYILIFCAFLIFPKMKMVYEGNILYFLLDFFGISDFFSTPTLQPVWWYMCFAQCEVLIIPFFVELCKKFGVASYILVFVVLQYVEKGIYSPYGGLYTNYLMVIVMGVLCAQYDLFEKIKEKSKKRMFQIAEFIILLSSIIFLVSVRVKYLSNDTFKLTTVCCSIAAVLICIIVYKYFTNKYISRVLLFLGKYSANMFLIHVFIYSYFSKFIFWSRNVLISWSCLMISSCLLAMLIEKFKDITKYNNIMRELQKIDML